MIEKSSTPISFLLFLSYTYSRGKTVAFSAIISIVYSFIVNIVYNSTLLRADTVAVKCISMFVRCNSGRIFGVVVKALSSCV